TPLFLPLIHKLARYLAVGPRDSSVTVGEPISAASPTRERDGDSGWEAQVLVPDGRRIGIKPSFEEGELRATFRETRAPGFYTMEILRGSGSRGEPGTSSTKVFSVSLPREESRLERLGEEAVAGLREHLKLEVLPDVREATPPAASE